MEATKGGECVLPVEAVQFANELFPRLRESEAAIERYRQATDQLPAIVVAERDLYEGLWLVDGFHRLQAHRREGRATIRTVSLGRLSDPEIKREAIIRNRAHGEQLSIADKRELAAEYWQVFGDLPNGPRTRELMDLLAVSERSIQEWTADARLDEKQRRKRAAWDLWLDCFSFREIGERLAVDHKTVSEWCDETARRRGNSPPDFHPLGTLWSFEGAITADDEDAPPPWSYSRVLRNVIAFHSEPGQIVFDPLAGNGAAIDAAKALGRRVWAADPAPSMPTLPIHHHDIRSGWPADAPKKVDLAIVTFRDGRTSDQTAEAAVSACSQRLSSVGKLVLINNPGQDLRPLDLDPRPYRQTCGRAGLKEVVRVIAFGKQRMSKAQIALPREKQELLPAPWSEIVVMANGSPASAGERTER